MLNFFVKHKNYLILLFTIFYLFGFTLNALGEGNLEFLYYTVLMTIIIFSVIAVHRRLHFGFFIIFNLSLLGFFHLLGGNYYVGDVRLYDYWFLPGLIKYDNIIHTFGTFTTTFVLYSLVAPFVYEEVKNKFSLFAFGLVLMSIGAGTINELFEFGAVVFLGAAEQVGGYYNNSLDLFFNTLGSILACFIIYIYLEKPRIMARLKEKK